MSVLDEIPPSEKLERLIALEAVGPDHFRNVGQDANLNGEVFGGQYLALAVRAAMRTADGRAPHALHSFFLRGASAARPVDFTVERTREGRAFAHRRITASQDGREVFRAEVSLHDWEEGQPSHAATPPVVAPPAGLADVHAIIRANAETLSPVGIKRALGRTSFSSCYEAAGVTVLKPADGPALNAWVHPNDPPKAGDGEAYYATLAYLGDACGNFACRASHSANVYDGTTASASLNHAVWFHARPRPIGWVLYAMDSPFAGGGLGYNRGTMFAQDGTVLASVVQEALIRWGESKEG